MSETLVCLMTKPMYFAPNSIPLAGVEKTRLGYLPFGGDWYDFWADICYAAAQDVDFALYEDEGDNDNYKQGGVATIHLV